MAVFLLREWISQNARPGVFEDEEVLPEEPAPQQPLANQMVFGPIPPPGQPPIRLQFPAPQVRRQLPPLPPIQQLAPPRGNNGELAVLHQRMDALLAMDTQHANRQAFNPVDAANPDRWTLVNENDDSLNRRQKKKKNRAKTSDPEEEDEDEALRYRKKIDPEEEAKRKMFHRRIHIARTTAARRRVFTKRGQSSTPSPPVVPGSSQSQQSTFDFTFKAPSLETSENGTAQTSHAGPSTSSSIHTRLSQEITVSSEINASPSREASMNLPNSLFTSSTSTEPSKTSSEEKVGTPVSPFPSVSLQPPSGGIPFALRKWDSPPPGSPPPPAYPARPPLPTITLPRSGSASPFIFTPGRTPVDSPSLATYRPPEELEAEAGSPGYFDFEDKRETREDNPGQEFELQTAKARGKKRQAEEEDQLNLGNDGVDDISDSSSDLDEDLVLMDMEAEHNQYFGDDPDPKPRMREGTPRPKPLELSSDTDSDGSDDADNDAEVFREAEEDEIQDEGFAFDEGAWEDADDDVAVNQGPEVQPEPGAVPADGAVQPGEAPNAANVDPNDEVDGNVEDDMEGAMEGAFALFGK